MGKLKELRTIVEKCLISDVASRSSDWKLYEDVCKSLGFNTDEVTIHNIVENKKSFPTFESVTRCRRKLQEGGNYKATADVTEFRRQQELDFRKEFA